MSKYLIGKDARPYISNSAKEIAFNDDKISFFVKYCKNKTVLDIGCVQHNPKNYESKFWLHKALSFVSSNCTGLDLYEDGVNYLRDKGYNVLVGDAQNYDLGEKFDVITAGDIIEHLENLSDFLECAKRHLKDDGVLVIATPHPWHWRSVVKGLFSLDTSPNPEHTCWFCIATLRQLLARHDMVYVEARGGMRTASKWAFIDRLVPLPHLRNNSIFAAAKIRTKT